MRGSLVKRSLTANEETNTLPRVDEFAAAIEASDDVGASVIACDVEIDQLIRDVTGSLTPMGWASLGINLAGETLGIMRETDPIRRRSGESVVEWAARRRDVATARGSKMHGEKMSLGLSKVLVDDRDERFARYCRKVNTHLSDDGKSGTIVCFVVGLVHLDGVAKRLVDTTLETK